jgi:hypothetical protein
MASFNSNRDQPAAPVPRQLRHVVADILCEKAREGEPGDRRQHTDQGQVFPDGGGDPEAWVHLQSPCRRKEKRPSDLTVIGRLPISETVVQCYRNTELVFERKPLDPFCIEAIRAFESRFPGEVGLCQLRSKRAKLLLAVRTIAYRSSQVLARLVVFLALLLGIWLVMLAGQPNGLWLASMIPMVLFGGGVLIATGVHQATGAEKLFPRILWGLLGTCALGLSLFIAVELGILISRL